jgi:hypothetical protein
VSIGSITVAIPLLKAADMCGTSGSISMLDDGPSPSPSPAAYCDSEAEAGAKCQPEPEELPVGFHLSKSRRPSRAKTPSQER